MKSLTVVKLTRTRALPLPESVCERLGLEPGDSVEIVEDAQGHLILRRPRRKLGALTPKVQLDGNPDAPLDSDFLRGFDSTHAAPTDL